MYKKFIFINLEVSSQEKKKNTTTNNKIDVNLNTSVSEGIFTGNYKNDGISGEFDGLNYPHSREMLKVCTNIYIFVLI